MIALGVDTGRWLGWATLSWDDARRVSTWWAGGVVDVEALGEDRALDALIDAASHRTCPTLVSIETVAQVHGMGGPMIRATHADQLVRAARLGGRLHGYYEGDKVEVRTPSVEQVRAHFLGSAQPRKGGKGADVDGALLAVCQQQIEAWPPQLDGIGAPYGKRGLLLAEHWAHVADAALAALYAATVAA